MLNEDVEQALIQRFQRGDESAYAELFNAFHRDVMRISLNLVRDEESALDVAQEVFLRIYKELADWRGEARLSTWLYRATLNVCFERIRVEEKHHRIRNFNYVEPAAPSADEIVSGSETVAIIDEAIRRLPPRQRAAFVLRHFEEMRFHQVARVLQISTEGAKANYHKALLSLRAALSSSFCEAPR